VLLGVAGWRRLLGLVPYSWAVEYNILEARSLEARSLEARSLVVGKDKDTVAVVVKAAFGGWFVAQWLVKL
jgi:hypothetical protein